uniref:Tryptophan synthase alpha chain n=1 Tax=Polysiphonia infestans TaxID=2006978 RepID=A0A1Z1ME14_9FLOR|nr:Tryptophan synthase alpha subunit [Polysiphonia infestans]ARW64307.1 Tryptophan synthase alpha subunit [Polysiphonia infestans]
MNHISNVLAENHKRSSYSFIPFITAGYPSIDFTLKALIELDKRGADVIELGVPYSDALADGDLIQEASKVAIKNGVNLSTITMILKKIYLKINTPIIIFTYYNPILVKGINSFICEISSLNVKGIIIPDLPLEEADYVIALCKSKQIELILFVSPTSSDSRICDIVKKSPGCLYLVSSTGLTGMRESLDNSINQISNKISSKGNKMIMLGFGIASPEQVRIIIESNKSINGIVVGSAFTQILSNYKNDKNCYLVRKVGEFCLKMKSATCV